MYVRVMTKFSWNQQRGQPVYAIGTNPVDREWDLTDCDIHEEMGYRNITPDSNEPIRGKW